MIVLDASAAVELLLQTQRAEQIAARALDPAERLHAPELIEIEVAQVLKRLLQARQITLARAELAFTDFEQLAIERHAHRPLLRRVWSLRSAVSAYDGAYVALAEALPAPLLTCDEKLSRAHGHSAAIELISGPS